MNALQKRQDLDIASTSLSIVAPVVVKPDTVSKRASVYLGISPDMTKGRAPIADIVIHDAATLTNPSIENMELSFGFLIVKIIPTAIVMINGMPKDVTT